VSSHSRRSDRKAVPGFGLTDHAAGSGGRAGGCPRLFLGSRAESRCWLAVCQTAPVPTTGDAAPPQRERCGSAARAVPRDRSCAATGTPLAQRPRIASEQFCLLYRWSEDAPGFHLLRRAGLSTNGQGPSSPTSSRKSSLIRCLACCIRL